MAAVSISLLCVLAAVQAPAASKPAAAAWPKLDGNRMKEFGLALDSLKRTLTPDGVEEMATKVASFGKGGVPLLYESLSRQKSVPEEDEPEDVKRVKLALERIVTKEDVPRLSGDVVNKSAFVRRFALRKLAEYQDPGALAAARKALTDHDEEARFEATLTCFALGSIDGMPVMIEAARDRWPKVGVRIRAALEKHRSDEATDRLVPLLAAKEWQEVCAGLRLLAGIGTKKCTYAVSKHLDSTDNRIKENAINALRGIVDNEKPIEKLSAFDLAEQANAWKKKL